MGIKGTSSLSLEERRKIQECIGLEIRNIRISELLKRSQSCISHEISKNGGRHVYDAEEAHQRFLMRLNIKVMKNTNHLEDYKRVISMEKQQLDETKQRVKSLEFQIEIISEQLKELYDRNAKD